MKKTILVGLVLGFVPSLALATNDISAILQTIFMWISWLVPVLITIAIIFFIWGVIQFISASDEEAKKLGRTRIINGLIGLFVIVAFWGIIAVVKNSFGLNAGVDTTSSIDKWR